MVRSIVWKINWDSFGTHNHGSTTVIKLVSEEENIFFVLFCLLDSPLKSLVSSSSPLLTRLLLGRFHPVASAAIGRFKWLLTGSTGDLWLHLSLTWNPVPLGPFSASQPHFILLSFIVLSGPPPVVSSLVCEIIFSSVVFFSLFDTFVWLFHLSNALFFSVFVSRTSWRLGDKEERAREKEQWRVYCGGISDYWATDRLNQSGGRGGWVSTEKHTLKNPIENQPRKEPD